MIFWDLIESHINTKAISPTALCSFREFIEAPEPPTELRRVLANFHFLFARLISIVPYYDLHLAKEISPEWKTVCKEILDHPDCDSLLSRLHKSGKKPLTGIYNTNKVYVAIWTRPTDTLNCESYFSLLAHILLAVSTLRKWMEEQRQNEELTDEDRDDYNDRIKRVFLSIRNLADAKNSYVLKALPSLVTTPQEILEIIQDGGEQLSEIVPLFRFLLKIRRPVHRHPVESPGPRIRVVAPYLKYPAIIVGMGTNLDPEQEPFVPLIEVLSTPMFSQKESDEIESFGCDPAESVSGAEIAHSSEILKEVLTPQQKAGRARQVKNQLSMRNQLLPYRWETLSLHEISSFLEAVSDLMDKGDISSFSPANGNAIELGALLTTIFWLGQRIERAVKLKCYQGDFSSKETEPGFVVAGDESCSSYWWIVPATRFRKYFPDEHQVTKTCPVDNAYPIVSGIGIEQNIDTYVSNFRKGESEYLFNHEVVYYEAAVEEFLNQVKKHFGTQSRLTVNRISDYLFDNISHRDRSDLTTAMYLTGRHHFLGINPSSYTATKISILQKTYRNVCTDILSRHSKERPNEGIKTTLQPTTLPEIKKFVGSPFVPTQDTVKTMASHLRDRLKILSSTKPSVLRLMRIHNTMTLYTAYLIGFCTGFRAVRDPFLSAAEIDWQSGFAILSDKDNEDCYNSRLIWIPPVCLKQLRLFQDHLQNTLYRFSNLIHDFYALLESPKRQGPGRYMFFYVPNDHDNQYEVRNFGPKYVGSIHQKVYGLPFNASRHYLRSRLLEAGCPLEAINSIMGHWERGEEPWGTYSGLSPIAYREALKEYLLPIIENDEWEALSGLGSAL